MYTQKQQHLLTLKHTGTHTHPQTHVCIKNTHSKKLVSPRSTKHFEIFTHFNTELTIYKIQLLKTFRKLKNQRFYILSLKIWVRNFESVDRHVLSLWFRPKKSDDLIPLMILGTGQNLPVHRPGFRNFCLKKSLLFHYLLFLPKTLHLLKTTLCIHFMYHTPMNTPLESLGDLTQHGLLFDLQK